MIVLGFSAITDVRFEGCITERHQHVETACVVLQHQLGFHCLT